MATQAIQNADPVVHKWISNDPSAEAKHLRRAAFCQSLLSKITLAAIAAISVAVLVASFVAGGATGSLPFVLVGLILITPFLAMVATKLNLHSNEAAVQAQLQAKIAEKLGAIRDWQEDQIRAFFNPYNIVPSNEIPLQRYLPLIARFQVRQELFEKLKRETDNELKAEDIQDRGIRLRARQLAWNKREQSMIPAALESALILQIAINPKIQTTLSDWPFTVKSPEERFLDRLYGPNDIYLEGGDQRPALTLQEIEDNLSPQALHQKLYPPVRV